ncbi:MAG: hypothetical protein ACLFTQ_02480 [Candidatus Aenigmatarchaeota archaeon]
MADFKGPLRKRSITFEGESGFPAGIYFDMVDVLYFLDYEVKKVEDWLEVTPNSEFYQDISQKKQSIENQVANITNKLSETRKELEMLRHDKRKLERIVDHKEEGDINVLKADYIDLVDRNTQRGLINLAQAGKFPSIVVDFYKVESEEDIEKLDVSKAEKEILRRKWKLFQDWLDRYVGEIETRLGTVESEIRSQEATIENLKDALKPYAKAMKRVRLSEPDEYEGLSDPTIVEKYPSSVAGVKLYAWKEISLESVKRHYEEIPPEADSLEYFCFLEIMVEKKAKVVAQEAKEGITIEITPSLKHRRDIEEKKKEIKRKERELLKSIQGMRGEISEEKEEEETRESLGKKLKGFGKRVLKIPGERESHPKTEAAFKTVIEEEVDIVYEKIKELGGGLKLRKIKR